MTRGMRLLLMVGFLIGVIVLMMDCARKMTRKQHQEGTKSSAEP